MSDMKVICLGNQKGGCSKTTSCLNIAYSYANTKHKRVILIDADSQGSASLNLGINITDENINTLDVLLGAYVRREIKEFIWDDVKNFIYRPTYMARRRVPNSTKWETVELPFGGEEGGCLDVIPSSLPLSLVELQMSIAANGGKVYSYYLYDLIECLKKQEKWDVCIIDTPPALGAISVNSMMASTSGIIIPSNLDLMSYRGIASFKESAEYVQETAKAKGIEHRGVIGILLSLYSERRSVDTALEEYVHEFYPTPTFSQQIRESSDCKRATAEGLLFAQVNKKAREDFDKLVDEIDFAINDKEGWEKKTEETWNEIKRIRGGN